MHQKETHIGSVRPRLSQSILILVLLPLLVFTLTLLVLKDASLQAEQMLVLEDKRCSSIRDLCLISSNWSELGHEMLALGADSNFSINQAPSGGLKQEERSGKQNDSDRVQQTVNESQRNSAKESTETNSIVKDLLSIDRLLTIKATAISMRDRILSEWQDELRLSEAGDKRVKRQKALALIVASIDVLVSITAVGFAFQTLVSRLQVIMKNAKLIGVAKASMAELKGNDELASLNDALKSIHQELLQSSDFYEMTVSMVAHDVRSPLTASLVNLRSLESTLQGHCEDAGAKLSKFMERVDSELAFVGNLLEQQKEKILENNPQIATSITSERAETSKHRIQFKLLPKGLLLLLIPLLVQISFLAVVNLEFNRKLQVANQARSLSELMTNMQLNKLDFISALSSYASFLLTGNNDLHDEYELSLLSIGSRLDELAKLVKFNSDWTKLERESANVFKTQMTLLADLKNSPESGIQTNINQLQKALAPLKVLREHFFELSQREASKLEKQEFELIRESDEISTLFAWGIVGNIIISFALLHWFKSDVQRRLFNLSLNATNLAEQNFQFAPVNGNDELSKLNTILAKTKKEIDSNFANRELLTRELVDRLVMPLRELKTEMAELVNEKQAKFTERAQTYAEQFRKNIDRTLQIISLIEQTGNRNNNGIDLKTETCESQSLLEEAVEAVQEFIAFKGLFVEKRVLSIQFTADRLKLAQVLSNLLSNAIKFSPKKSTIELGTEIENGKKLRFSVKDAGPGLNPEEQSKIFGRFVQGSSAEKNSGYGVGLAICKMIVEAHGGEIGVISGENSGCTFWFTLPLKSALIPAELQETRTELSETLSRSDDSLSSTQNSAVASVYTEKVCAQASNLNSVWGKQDISILAIFLCSFASEIYLNIQIDLNAKKLQNNLIVQKVPPAQAKTDEDARARDTLSAALVRFHNSSSQKERLEIIESVNKLISQTDKPEVKFACYVAKAVFEGVLDQPKNAIAAQKQATIYSLKNGQETTLTAQCYALMAMYYYRLSQESATSSQNFIEQLERYAKLSLKLLENETTPVLSSKYSSFTKNSLPSEKMSRYLSCCYLGKAYLLKKDKLSLEKAITYLTRARKLAQKADLGLASAEADATLASALWLSGQKKKSSEIIHRLEIDARRDSNAENQNQALAWKMIGDYYLGINDDFNALKSFKIGLGRAEKLSQNKPVLRKLFGNSIKRLEAKHDYR